MIKESKKNGTVLACLDGLIIIFFGFLLRLQNWHSGVVL